MTISGDLRWKWMKAVFFMSLYTAATVFVFFQIGYIFRPSARDILLSVLISCAAFVVSFIFGLYYGYRETSILKKRLGDLSAFITVMKRGNLSQRMKDSETDEIGQVAGDLNELADKIQQQVQSLQKMANEKTEFAEQARSAATIEERQRLARDLHDAVSQQLFALNMMSSANVKLIDRDVDKARIQMNEIADIAAKAQWEMRALLLHLRPVHLSGDPLEVGVGKLVKELEAKSGIRFEWKGERLKFLAIGIEDHLFRIIQEGLGNALRHSEASVIKIELYEKNRFIHLHMRDNGVGFDLEDEKKASYGLKTMKERCEEIGGILNITSREGEGTALDIRVPISEEEVSLEENQNHDRG